MSTFAENIEALKGQVPEEAHGLLDALKAESENRDGQIGDLETKLGEFQAAFEKSQEAPSPDEGETVTTEQVAAATAAVKSGRSTQERSGLGSMIFKSGAIDTIRRSEVKDHRFTLTKDAVGFAEAFAPIEVSPKGSIGSSVVPPKLEGRRLASKMTQLPTDTPSFFSINYTLADGELPTDIAPGTPKPEAGIEVDVNQCSVKKIAAVIHVPEECLDDVPGTQQVLNSLLVQRLYDAENACIKDLIRTEGNHLPFDPAATGVAPEYVFDFGLIAESQLLCANVGAPFCWPINPKDWGATRQCKGADGQYVCGPCDFNPDYFPLNCLELGEFIYGNLGQYGRFRTYSDLEIRMYDQHANNATCNVITFVVEQRFCLEILCSDAVVYGPAGTIVKA